jgi:hypothetical protein
VCLIAYYLDSKRSWAIFDTEGRPQFEVPFTLIGSTFSWSFRDCAWVFSFYVKTRDLFLFWWCPLFMPESRGGHFPRGYRCLLEWPNMSASAVTDSNFCPTFLCDEVPYVDPDDLWCKVLNSHGCIRNGRKQWPEVYFQIASATRVLLGKYSKIFYATRTSRIL